MTVLAALLVCFAPAPLPRPAPPPPAPVRAVELAGSWAMTWGGAEYQASFCAGDVYLCTYRGEWPWEGTWGVKDGELTVTEGPVGGGHSMTWHFTLARSGRGFRGKILAGGAVVKLER